MRKRLDPGVRGGGGSGTFKNDLKVGRACQHPTDAARWDEHRALLRCTSCGRNIEDGAERSGRPVNGT